MYIIKRVDNGGGYVARAGSKHSYTHSLENARTWPTREQAEGDKCENEVVLHIDSIFK